MTSHAFTERRTMPPYAPPEALRATIALLRHYRAFLASPCHEMRDPRQWGVYLTKAQARHRLTSLIHVAVNRRAGIPDSPSRKHEADYQRHLRPSADPPGRLARGHPQAVLPSSLDPQIGCPPALANSLPWSAFGTCHAPSLGRRPIPPLVALARLGHSALGPAPPVPAGTPTQP